MRAKDDAFLALDLWVLTDDGGRGKIVELDHGCNEVVLDCVNTPNPRSRVRYAEGRILRPLGRAEIAEVASHVANTPEPEPQYVYVVESDGYLADLRWLRSDEPEESLVDRVHDAWLKAANQDGAAVRIMRYTLANPTEMQYVPTHRTPATLVPLELT